MNIRGLYTIPAAHNFAESLAGGLLQETKDSPEELARYLILLPTRRACRNVQAAFLKLTDGKPLLLPRLQPIGDIDQDELSLHGLVQGNEQNQGQDIIHIPEAMPPMQRQILLSRLISALPDFSNQPGQNMTLAAMLGQLMDQIYTEDLDIQDLPSLIDNHELSEHWQITTKFLEVLSKSWPEILAEKGLIDTADRRNRLLKALNSLWQQSPPGHPVIIAGSTGSIPATAVLMKTALSLPRGSLILPAFDMAFADEKSDELWQDIEEGHPQATFKKLLGELEAHPSSVQIWPHLNATTPEQKAREDLAHLFMLPAAHTARWNGLDELNTQPALKGVKRYDCATAQEEAMLIAVLMREALEDTDKVTALITPDRNLAIRVRSLCKRWDIALDDSAGQALSETALGSYLRLCAQYLTKNLKPAAFLALLKHDFAHGGKFACRSKPQTSYDQALHLLEKDILRGPPPAGGFEGLYARFHDKTKQASERKHVSKPSDTTLDFLKHLEEIFSPALELFTSGTHPFEVLMKAHLTLAEALATNTNRNGEDVLWSGETGNKAAGFFAGLREYSEYFPPLNGEDYCSICEELMSAITIRPKYGTHPRLMILGQLEARLLQADRIILAGLNEGTWPPDARHDPWMSRPMREKFGLPLPERAITLAAHDFVQGFCGKEVFLTRAQRLDGTPSVPARWLERLETCLNSLEIDTSHLYDGPHLTYVRQMDLPHDVTPAPRPKPTPPLSSRPQKLSVTWIEKWMKDPYTIYAGKILNLRALDPLEQNMDAAQNGIILHETLEKFNTHYPGKLPDTKQSVDEFITIAKETIEDHSNDLAQWYFWQSRLVRLAEFYIEHEINWREEGAQFNAGEIEGEITLADGLQNPFTLTARIDRIDRLHNNHYALIDYKSGGVYSKSKMISGELPQLPLEALILEHSGFGNIKDPKSGYIGYWKLTGAKKTGEIIAIDDPDQMDEIIARTKSGIQNLVQVFEDEKTPYLALPDLDNVPRFNDFEHLERVKEWATLGDNDSEQEAA